MTPLRIGLIGVGKHGSRYAQHLVEDLPQARLVAVCRRNQLEGQQVADRYHCAYYQDFRDMIADARVDAIVAAVPPTLHRAIVEAACSQGKHLLIEKPFAISVAEAERMRDTIAASDVRCMVAHTLRFNAVVQAMRHHIPDIAPLYSIYLSQRFEPSSLAWLDRKAESGGGIVLHTGVHSFDLLHFLTGCAVQQVTCQTTRVVTRETEDNFVITCDFSDSLLKGVVMGSRSTVSRSGLIELSGAHGQLVGDHAHGTAVLLKGWQRTELPVGPPIPTVRETLRAFIDGIQTDAPFPITVEDGLRAVAVAEACYRSARSGQPERVQLAKRGWGFPLPA